MGTKAVNENPTWLTQSFLERLLRAHYKDESVTVKQFTSASAVPNGQNFASELYRVTIEFTRYNENPLAAPESLVLIFKVHPKGLSGQIIKKNLLFDREIKIYTEILPIIQQKLETIGEFTKIAPVCLQALDSPVKMLILEDLQAYDYHQFEHGRLINLDHALLILEKLAKFHAASAIVFENFPKLMDLYREGYFSENPDKQDFLEFFPANIKSLAEEVVQWKGYEEIGAKLAALEEKTIEKGLEVFTDSEDTFRVLNHNDMWISNFMFHYTDHEVDDAVVLDYQLAYFGSPAIDLNYLLFGSINENVRKVHFKFMVREYHRHLKGTLEALHYSGHIPTLKEIHIELIKKGFHAVIASACLTPLIFMEPGRTTELEGLIDRTKHGQDIRRENIENSKYKTFIQKQLKEFELSGFLD